MLIEREDVAYEKFCDVSSCSVDIRALFNKDRQFVMQALNSHSSNLLNHTYFRTHPRTFVKHYLRTMEIFLSLESKSALSYASNWTEKATEKVSLCRPFPAIFKSLTLSKTMVAIRKKEYAEALLHMIELTDQEYIFQNDSESSSKEAEKVLEFLDMIGAKVAQAPILRRLEKFVQLENGIITIIE